jgi:soluble calcium-activated nucleotidase 1
MVILIKVSALADIMERCMHACSLSIKNLVILCLGMKWEWATVKDGELIMGSIGKELTNKDLTFKSQAGMWVVAMNAMGETRRIDWTEEYTFVRMQLFADLPGYVVHEAVHWSHHLRKWVFLPRRISQQPYSPSKDEHLGSNKVLLVDEGFTTSTTVDVHFEKYKEEDGGLHGFSAFSFVPNTKDRHVLATRSVEEGCYNDDIAECKFRTYFCVFDILTGELLMDEVLYDTPLKFEGLEFVDMYATPPPSVIEY